MNKKKKNTNNKKSLSNQSTLDKLYVNSIDHFVNWRKHLKEYIVAFAVALSLRATVLTIYRIPTGSMIPTFLVGDVLIANKFWYGMKIPFTEDLDGWRLPAIKEPKSGDIIIFRAPKERFFRELSIGFVGGNENKAREFLLQLNDESKDLKKPFSIESWGSNYIVKNSVDLFEQGEGVLPKIVLPFEVYKKYKNDLYSKSLFYIASDEELRYSVSYDKVQYAGFFNILLEMPLKAGAIIGDVLLKTPYFQPLKALLAEMDRRSDLRKRHLNTGFTEAFRKFHLYPNPNFNMSRDYVKRMVADEGDTVEIKNQILYVNGEAKQNFEPYKEGILGTIEGLPAQQFSINRAWVEPNDKSSSNRLEFPVVSLQKELYNNLVGANHPAVLSVKYPMDYRSEHVQYLSVDFGPFLVPEGHVFALGDNRPHSEDGRYWGFLPKHAIKGKAMFRVFPINRLGLFH